MKSEKGEDDIELLYPCANINPSSNAGAHLKTRCHDRLDVDSKNTTSLILVTWDEYVHYEHFQRRICNAAIAEGICLILDAPPGYEVEQDSGENKGDY